MTAPGTWQQTRTLSWWRRMLLRIDLFIHPIWMVGSDDDES